MSYLYWFLATMTGTPLSLIFKLNPYYTSTTLTSYGNVDIASVRYGYLFGCLSFLFRIFFEGTEFYLTWWRSSVRPSLGFEPYRIPPQKFSVWGRVRGAHQPNSEVLRKFEFDQLVTFLFQNYRTNRKMVNPQPHYVRTI